MMQIPLRDAHGNEVRINPGYNIRLLFPQLVETILQELSQGEIPAWMQSYLTPGSVSAHDLVRATTRYAHFMSAALSDKTITVKGALEATGFLEESALTRLLVFARLGQLLTGAFWSTYLDGTYADESPPDAARLSALAREVAQALGITPANGGEVI